jgi:DNA mismatch repair ATPase MutS
MIQKRQEEVSWILNKDESHIKELETALNLIYDISRIHRSILRGTIHASDSINLYQSYQSAKHIWSLLKKSPFIESESGSKSKQKPLLDTIQQCIEQFTEVFDIEKAKNARLRSEELGFLQNSVAPKTAEAEKRCEEIYNEGRSWLETLQKHTGTNSDNSYASNCFILTLLFSLKIDLSIPSGITFGVVPI